MRSTLVARVRARRGAAGGYTEEVTAPAISLPTLENGDVMSREEFHARFEAHPGLERVELIEGVVYMPSPVRIIHHAVPQALLLKWLFAYEDLHPGLLVTASATVFLDGRNEPIPDAMLLVEDTMRTQEGYLLTPPDLIVEVAASTRARDTHQKKDAYERNGVAEYVVWRVEDAAIDWFILRDGVYELLAPGADGIVESERFSGLRLDVPAALALDRRRVRAAVR
jgi:Uma2 family endonuclease